MNTKKTAIILSIMALVGTGAVMPTLAADVVFPEMAARSQAYTKEALPKAKQEAYDANYNQGILAAGKVDGKWSFIGTDGSVKFGPFKKVEQVRTSIYKVTDDKGTYYMDDAGKVVTSLPPVTSEGATSELTKFKEQGRYGFKNVAGRVVIPPTLKDVYTDFSEGIAFVKNDQVKKVAIDEMGKELFAAPYDEFFPYQDGLAEYRRHVSSFNLGNFLGAIVGSAVNNGIYYPGDTLTYDGVKRGYLDKAGNIVIDSKNDQVYPISKFGTFVKNDGKLGFVNRPGTYIIQPGNYDIASNMMDDISGFAALKNKDINKVALFSLVDGAQVTKFDYDKADIIGGERMFLTQGDAEYFVDTKTGTIVAQFPKDTQATMFLFEGYTWIWNDKKVYQIIDKSGKVLYTAPKGMISEVNAFRHGVSVVKSKGLYGIMDAQGNWVVQPQYKKIHML